jgi:serpin B
VVLGVYRKEGLGGDRGTQADLSHRRLAGRGLHGLHLPYANLSGVACTGQNLTGADLEGSLLVDSDWTGSVLRGANLSHADLSRAELRGCDLRKADLTGADLENADLTGADLRGSRWEGARFLGAWLEGCRFDKGESVPETGEPATRGAPAPAPPVDGARDFEEMVDGNSAFAVELYARLAEAEGNLFLSPFSISAALAMTYAGARGETERQMEQALHLSLGQERVHPALGTLQAGLKAIQGEGSVRLSVANALWPQVGYAFLEAFLAVCRDYYGVAITPLDFRADPEAARLRINGWVEERTEQRIKNLIEKDVIDRRTRMVLVNAIYFKGDWARQFEEHRTEEAPFRLLRGGEVPVQMMAQRATFGYAALDGVQILELPYAGGDLSMVIVLPEAAGGLPDLEKSLTPARLADWLKQPVQTEVQVFLPRFRLEGKFILNQVLAALGMPDAFDEEKANFAGIDGRPDWLYVAYAIHQAFVEVNEQGTEAAAATAVIIVPRMALIPMPAPIFRADHPFLFLMREKETGSILFMGRMVEPAAG